ncbi:MAG: afr 1 [Verrucomicrobiaceae bacterium]|nr:afr 1 [Verrucomicrobiaceae bacterium]
MSTPTSSRRDFLKKTAATTAVLGFPAILRAASPNSMVQVASVGVDGMAFSDITNIHSHEKVKYVGFCDVDTSRFEKVDKLAPGVPHFQDFREMFDKLGDSIDAVNIAIPDHMHAKVATEAMLRGKHVYCQKPLAHTVWECRQMRLLAEKKKVITQMGNQIHSSIQYRMGTQLIKDGAIGKIKEVHSWVGVTGNERTRLLEPPAPGPVPATLNWDLWIGSAPMREFAPEAYHPFVWRDWQDFGGGAQGDFGCHILDPVFTALGLQAPLSVIADNSGFNKHVWPVNETVRWVFPGNELIAGKTLNVTWSDGGLKPARKLAGMPPEMELPASGSLFIGESGTMVLPHVGPPGLYPKEKFATFKYPEMEKIDSHWHRWINGIMKNEKTTDGFHYAGWLAETVQLGNVATRMTKHPSGSKGGQMIEGKGVAALEWDAANLKFPNMPEAEKYLTKTYRPGWEVKPA